MLLSKPLHFLFIKAFVCLFANGLWLQAYGQDKLVGDPQQHVNKLDSIAYKIILPQKSGNSASSTEDRSTEVALQQLNSSNERTSAVQVKGQLVVTDSIQTLFSIFAEASKSFNYRSMLTYEANGFITTYKLTHWSDEAATFEQLVFMDGPRRKVLRRQGLTDCHLGKEHLTTLFSYSLKILGAERIADREAIVFDVQSKDEFRYSYRYSIDQQTGLILRVVTYNQRAIVERLQTVSLEFLASPEELLVDDNSGYIWRVPETNPCQTEQFKPNWQVEWLPEGFFLAGIRTTAQGEQVMVFTDGLVSLSVFIANQKLTSLNKATARHGATVVVVSPIDRQPNRNVAVVGEVPIPTARRIAVSVKPL